MSNDPLDAVFVTGDEAAELKRTDTARKLAMYLERMPAELLRLFGEQFQHIGTSELAQLRADLQASQERIAEQARQLEQLRGVLDDIRTCAAYSGGKYTISGELFDEVVLTLDAANPAPQEPQPPNGEGKP